MGVDFPLFESVSTSIFELRDKKYLCRSGAQLRGKDCISSESKWPLLLGREGHTNLVSMNHFAHVFECIHVRLSFCSSKAKNKCFGLKFDHVSWIHSAYLEIPTPKGAALFRSCNFLVAQQRHMAKKNSII